MNKKVRALGMILVAILHFVSGSVVDFDFFDWAMWIFGILGCIGISFGDE